jgi:hypothetical protein
MVWNIIYFIFYVHFICSGKEPYELWIWAGEGGTNRIFKNFYVEDFFNFFHFPPVSTTPVVHLELRISPPIFEKIVNGPNGKLRS